MKHTHKILITVLTTFSFFLLGFSITAVAEKWFPTNKTNCQIWNANPQPIETAYWSGKCANGKAHGYGTLIWSGGSKYIGQYNYGYMDGLGKLTWGNEEKKWVGDSYVGEFKQDFMHGEGVYTYLNGKIDEGIWKKGKFVKKKKVTDLQNKFAKLKELNPETYLKELLYLSRPSRTTR